MSTKVTIELKPKDVERLVGKLSIEDKIALVRKLEKELWGKRLDIIIRNIKSRSSKAKLSRTEISQEVKKARNKFYASRH